MNVREIRRNATSDETYNNFTLEYSKVIPEEVDKDFSKLINNIYNYLLDQGSTEDIKENLKEIKDSVELLEEKNIIKYINFNSDTNTNLKLSFLLYQIIRLRKNIYKKAYYIASDIIDGKITDPEIHEDFNLARTVALKYPVENFNADIRIYVQKENIERFYNECYLLELISDILEGKTVPIEVVEELEQKLDNSNAKVFAYLKKRFIPRVLKKRAN